MFFALDILFEHLSELSESSELSFLSHYTNAVIGVKGFFVISGFLVAKSYINTPSLKDYFIKRAKRILPAYGVVLLLSVLILSVFSSYDLADYYTNRGTYLYLGWNLFFLNFMHPCLPGVFESNLYCFVNGSLWTLKIEEGFYVVLPVLFYLINKIKKPFLVLITVYVLSLLYWYIANDYFNKPVLAKQLPGFMSYFVVGIFLFMNFNTLIKYKKQLAPIAFSIVLIYFFTNVNVTVLFPAAFGTLVVILAYSLPFLNKIGKYGDFTYGIYIYHFPIIQLFRQCNLFERYNPLLMAIAILLLTLIMAVFSWYIVEKRFLDRYKNEVKLVIKN
jgi:peptidoglycan/LPS O-acetylase OafA/YrhL